MLPNTEALPQQYAQTGEWRTHMTPVIIFLIGLVLTTGIVFLALLYLRSSLQAILVDLCGTGERARFWTAFSNITLFLVPFVLALNNQPPAERAVSFVFIISNQIKSAVIGFIVSVVILGMVLNRYITRSQLVLTSKSVDTHQSGSREDAGPI
jgi:hypothetical protein